MCHTQLKLQYVFQPEELNVTTSGNVLVVEGEHKETDDDGESFVSRKFYRSFELPKNCKVDQAQSNFTRSGQLTIAVPKENVAPEECTTKNVAIRQEA